MEMDPARFDALVDEALDAIPEELAAQVHNLVVLVEDWPPPDVPQDTLGLYDGVAITERNDMWGGGLPDRVFVYRRPLLAMCESEEELVDEVRITVVHEIAHHFGISDERLHELGWA
ncbi:metallopeptidase family protein [Nocardioides sp. DS6]|uniref:Metallopeptidase family protein n=1 Tax=Nocardioides eburneus TaxID=3231482 RepID=A0ABV3T030_9ACTN